MTIGLWGCLLSHLSSQAAYLHPGQTKVQELDRALAVQEQIGRFRISMDHAISMLATHAQSKTGCPMDRALRLFPPFVDARWASERMPLHLKDRKAKWGCASEQGQVSQSPEVSPSMSLTDRRKQEAKPHAANPPSIFAVPTEIPGVVG